MEKVRALFRVCFCCFFCQEKTFFFALEKPDSFATFATEIFLFMRFRCCSEKKSYFIFFERIFMTKKRNLLFVVLTGLLMLSSKFASCSQEEDGWSMVRWGGGRALGGFVSHVISVLCASNAGRERGKAENSRVSLGNGYRNNVIGCVFFGLLGIGLDYWGATTCLQGYRKIIKSESEDCGMRVTVKRGERLTNNRDFNPQGRHAFQR